MTHLATHPILRTRPKKHLASPRKMRFSFCASANAHLPWFFSGIPWFFGLLWTESRVALSLHVAKWEGPLNTIISTHTCHKWAWQSPLPDDRSIWTPSLSRPILLLTTRALGYCASQRKIWSYFGLYGAELPLHNRRLSRAALGLHSWGLTMALSDRYSTYQFDR